MLYLTWFQRWILRKIIIRIIIYNDMRKLFAQVFEIHREIYSEDNFFDHAEQMNNALQLMLNEKKPRANTRVG